MLKPLMQRCARVIGATQGIGRAIAEQRAAAGTDLVLHGIEAAGITGVALPVDGGWTAQ